MRGASRSRTAVVLVVLLAVLAGLHALGPSARAVLRLEPARLTAEPWRALTGHLVHLTWRHTLLNWGTVAVFAGVFPRLLSKAGLVVALCAAVGVDIGISVGHPDVDWYVGLSGVVYGLIAGGAVLETGGNARLSTLVLLGLAAKLALDSVYGTPDSTEAFVGGSVLAEAHVYGAIGGALAAASVMWGWERWRRLTAAPAKRRDSKED